jgi:hypothetical protein
MRWCCLPSFAAGGRSARLALLTDNDDATGQGRLCCVRNS